MRYHKRNLYRVRTIVGKERIIKKRKLIAVFSAAITCFAAVLIGGKMLQKTPVEEVLASAEKIKGDETELNLDKWFSKDNTLDILSQIVENKTTASYKTNNVKTMRVITASNKKQETKENFKRKSKTVTITVTPTPTQKPENKNNTASKTLENQIELLESKLKNEIKATAFAGNSLIEGLEQYNPKSKAKFLHYRGLAVNTATVKEFTKLKNGSEGTLIEALAEGTYENIFLMFGINEIGWKRLDIFEERYVEVIKEIQKKQPNATIYVQSILPVTEKTSKSDKVFNNENVKKFNIEVEKAAKEAGAVYLDVGTALYGKGNPLPEEAASDGIHLTKEYCQKWYKYLLEVIEEKQNKVK